MAGSPRFWTEGIPMVDFIEIEASEWRTIGLAMRFG